MDFSLPHISTLSLQDTIEDNLRRVSAAPVDTPLALKNSGNSAPSPSVSKPPTPGADTARDSRPVTENSPAKRSIFRRRNATSQPSPKKSFSLSNFFKRRNRSRKDTANGSSTTDTHDPPSTSTTHPSDIQPQRHPDTIPDLDAVNRALTSLPPRLPSLGFEIRNTPRKYRALLLEAIHHRSQGEVEQCRAKCIAIVNGPDAPVETRIYAFNILSTLASWRGHGRAERFLRESERLVRENVGEEPDLERLLGVIRSLREEARGRGGDG